MYEVVWSKYLALMFGSTVEAQTVVLAVFMGGLAVGNRVFGAWADRIQRPLAGYGLVELAIGAYAFSFPVLYASGDWVFTRLGGSMLHSPALLTGFKGLLSVALLLGPTILMGGTLPLMASWLASRRGDARRRSALFYAINSLGAVTGSAAAGFFLIRAIGMESTLQMTAIANLTLGWIAFLVGRRGPRADGVPAPDSNSTDGLVAFGEGARLRWGAVIVAVTGAVSMGMEVLASRMLGLIFGGSLQAFSMVLVAFILGIGIGSACVARLPRVRCPEMTVALLAAAVGSIALFVAMIEFWVVLYAKARSGLAASTVGYFLHQSLMALIAMIVLGLPAACLGAVLPLWIREPDRGAKGLARWVGRLLTWNTLGAVVGVLVTGFVLMPALGLRAAITTLGCVLAVAAMGVGFLADRRRWSMAGLLGVVAMAAASGSAGDAWRHALSSGVFRIRLKEIPWDLLEERRRHLRILFYEDAADATVSVEAPTRLEDQGERILRINGKPDASTRGDLATQYLLGHIPMTARPDADHVFILGFGSGITGGAVLGHPVESMVVAENCAPVLRAAELFAPWNRDVLNDPRTRVWREDARTILKLDPTRYDIIISEPSNPWVAGIGSVFSREFYELAASRLEPGGIMAQWFHIYEMHDGIVELVIRTFSSVFPHMEIWEMQSSDLVLLGSEQPWESNPDTFARIFTRDGAREDLERIGLGSPEALLTRRLASQRTAPAIAGPGAMQSDVFPILEFDAPFAFYLGNLARGVYGYDERAWQSDLASPETRRAAAALGREAFGRGTVEGALTQNEALHRYFQWRRGLALEPDQTLPPFPDSATFPVLFQPEGVYSGRPDLPPDVPIEWVRIHESEALLYAQPESRLKWAGRIEEQLRAVDWNTAPDMDGVQPPAHFAAVAARAFLREGRWATADRCLTLGLERAPNDPGLKYLSRILRRWSAADGYEPRAP